jgi:hypothetical protein
MHCGLKNYDVFLSLIPIADKIEVQWLVIALFSVWWSAGTQKRKSSASVQAAL